MIGLKYIKRKVGAVIVKDNNILAFGFNGMPAGMTNECKHSSGATKKEVIHAEANAIVQAAKNGISINNSEIYVTASPCYNCFKLIANSGIKTIY